MPSLPKDGHIKKCLIIPERSKNNTEKHDAPANSMRNEIVLLLPSLLFTANTNIKAGISTIPAIKILRYRSPAKIQSIVNRT